MGLGENKVDQDGRGAWIVRLSECQLLPPDRLCDCYSTVPLVLVVIMLRRHLKSNDIYRHYIHFVIL